jgi:hypothetical protein
MKPYSAITALAVVASVMLCFPGAKSGDAQNAKKDSVFPQVFLRDVIVSNTDPDLKNHDNVLNSEPGIAVDPANPRNIVISSFSGAWNQVAPGQFLNAPIWFSKDGGELWTKEFTIPVPPGIPTKFVNVAPCDETFDYGRNGVLYGTFLVSPTDQEGSDCSTATAVESSPEADFSGEVVSGATRDPSSAAAWRWLIVDGKTKPTNSQAGPDQPWLVVNRNPIGRDEDEDQEQNGVRDRVYVAYQAGEPMRVAVADGKAPPDFTVDNSTGISLPGFSGNPGLRIAADHRTGAVYSLHQTVAPIQCMSIAGPIDYTVNRSTDGGVTWSLNGDSNGIVAAQACSTQNLFSYSFGELEPGTIAGGVNPLKGGVDAIAVDSASGDVYVAYGNFDESAGRDRISIVRLTPDGKGGLKAGASHFVSGPEHQSALPAVAVNSKGAVAVLYDTADALDPNLTPIFSVHLALSRDHGETFEDKVLETFLFPGRGFGSSGPRPLGDYQQLKALGPTFYGVFTGDGSPFGRPFPHIDPIFFATSTKEAQ